MALNFLKRSDISSHVCICSVCSFFLKNLKNVENYKKNIIILTIPICFAYAPKFDYEYVTYVVASKL